MKSGDTSARSAARARRRRRPFARDRQQIRDDRDGRRLAARAQPAERGLAAEPAAQDDQVLAAADAGQRRAERHERRPDRAEEHCADRRCAPPRRSAGSCSPSAPRRESLPRRCRRSGRAWMALGRDVRAKRHVREDRQLRLRVEALDVLRRIGLGQPERLRLRERLRRTARDRRSMRLRM